MSPWLGSLLQLRPPCLTPRLLLLQRPLWPLNTEVGQATSCLCSVLDTSSCSACGLWVDERAPQPPALLTPLPGCLPQSLKTGLGVPSPVHSLPQPQPVTTGHQVCFPNYSDPEGIDGTGGPVLSTAGTHG